MLWEINDHDLFAVTTTVTDCDKNVAKISMFCEKNVV